MSALTIPTVTLNSGHAMPLLGLGTWPLKGARSTESTLAAIETGYRLLDTAARYENEDSVGAAVEQCGLDRGELFVTTKLRGSEQGSGSTREGLSRSLDRLGLDYVDLYLIHWPLARLGKFVESYTEMLTLVGEGLVRSVGVANFKTDHLAAIVQETGVEPAVNQIQVSPSIAKPELVQAIQQTTTVVQAWSPLERNTGVLEEPIVVGIAQERGVQPSQVVLRWLIERGIATVPHSGNAQRQRENADIFGFSLSADDMTAIGTLHRLAEGQLDPDSYEEF